MLSVIPKLSAPVWLQGPQGQWTSGYHRRILHPNSTPAQAICNSGICICRKTMQGSRCSREGRKEAADLQNHFCKALYIRPRRRLWCWCYFGCYFGIDHAGHDEERRKPIRRLSVMLPMPHCAHSGSLI